MIPTTKRSFRASRQLKLHERAVDCLDMIVTCDKRLANAQDYVKRWYSSKSWWDMIRIVNKIEDLEAEVEKYERVKQRLTAWYCDIMKRINDVALAYLENKIEVPENY